MGICSAASNHLLDSEDDEDEDDGSDLDDRSMLTSSSIVDAILVEGRFH